MNRPWETVEALEFYDKEQLIAHILWLYKKIESYEEIDNPVFGR